MNKTKKIGGSKKKKNKTRRNKSTKVTNASKRSDGTLIFKDYPDFRPNLTPREIFKLGSFGGTYWRPIYSSVVDKNLIRDNFDMFFINLHNWCYLLDLQVME